MPRRLRQAAGGFLYHVLNRAAGRARIFADGPDYLAFERTLAEAHAFQPIRLLAYCVMPNHFHLLLWPTGDGDLSRFMHWLTLTHTQRYRAAHESVGSGPLYQGRFKSFPVQRDGHFRAVARYVEQNALRAGLVGRAEDWRWCSLWRRLNGSEGQKSLLARWPIDYAGDWTAFVNGAGSARELEALRTSVVRGQPFGSGSWLARTVARLGLEATFRAPGRPRTSAKLAKKP